MAHPACLTVPAVGQGLIPRDHRVSSVVEQIIPSAHDADQLPGKNKPQVSVEVPLRTRHLGLCIVPLKRRQDATIKQR